MRKIQFRIRFSCSKSVTPAAAATVTVQGVDEKGGAVSLVGNVTAGVVSSFNEHED